MHRASISKAIHLFALAASAGLILVSGPSSGEESLKNTPFSYGEDFPDLTVSCEDVRGWASKAPNTEVRFNLAARGKLSRVSADGALAYLIMCQEPNPKIICVTYSTNGMGRGDVVTFAGGFRQLDPEQIVLDPCLASRG